MHQQDYQQCTKEEARAIFKKAIGGGGGAIVSTKHARKRMREKNVDNNDILNLAKVGIVANAPELDIKTNQWTYRIERGDPLLKAVFTVLAPNRVRLITIFTD